MSSGKRVVLQLPVFLAAACGALDKPRALRGRYDNLMLDLWRQGDLMHLVDTNFPGTLNVTLPEPELGEFLCTQHVENSSELSPGALRLKPANIMFILFKCSTFASTFASEGIWDSAVPVPGACMLTLQLSWPRTRKRIIRTGTDRAA